jgi:hypothetical protein
MRRLWTSVVIVAALAEPASGHILMLDPKPRTTALKVGPCGSLNSPKGPVVATYEPGETITVVWKETINHPGHYRISFDPDGHDDFVDPASFVEIYSNDAVLQDDIPDKTTSQAIYEASVTLPDVECDTCTLQLIQVMTDKPPYGDGNDLYYQCADIALVAPVPPCADPPGDVDGSGDATVVDVQCSIVAALWELAGGGGEAPVCLGGDPLAADLDCNAETTVADVTVCIQLALGQPLSELIDADGDLCPDACSAP